MSDKKRKESSGRQQRSKRLRQATLFESPTKSERSTNIESAHKSITPGRHKRKRLSESESSDIGAIQLEPVTPSRKSHTDGKRSHPSRSLRPQKRKVVVDSESGGEEEKIIPGDSETDSSMKPRRQRLSRRVLRGSSSSKERPPPRRRLLSKGKGRELKQVNSTDEETSGDEIDKDRIIEPRFRARNKKTVFQKNLERLKRKKQGKPMSSESGEESEESEETVDNRQPFKGAKPASDDGDSLFSGEDDSDGSSSFIVEDDNQAAATQLPTEFSMRSHDDLSHQFKVIFQFFVHVTVRPAVDRRAFMNDQITNQEYFSFPLKVTRRKLSGIRDSLVASSVWRPRFKKELEKYPTFELIPLDFAIPSCDACHLGGRLSTVMGRLGGIPYERLGFMDQVIDSNEAPSDDSAGSSASTTNFKKSKFGFLEFHLGRFCARRVRIYHEFMHWEYHLFHTIRSELDDLRAAKASHGFVRVAFPGGKQPPTDLTDADTICDWLDERGLIDREWYKMKKMMESAHHLELSAKKGEED